MQNQVLRLYLLLGAFLTVALLSGSPVWAQDQTGAVPIKIGASQQPAVTGGRPPQSTESKIAGLKYQVQALQAENKDLKAQLIQLKQSVEQNAKVLGAFTAAYEKHTHPLDFGFSNPKTVVNSPSNILVPWISSGQMKSGVPFATGGPNK